MSKKSKILLACAAALLLSVTVFFLSLPQIVRWTIPRIIEAETGYQATIESIDLSLAKPSITLSGISLHSKTGRELMGTVGLLSFTGSWSNPIGGKIISPRIFIMHGVDAQLEFLGKAGGTSADLNFLFSLLFQFQVVTVDAERLVVATPDGIFKMRDAKAAITPPGERDRKKNRALKGSVLLTASGKTGDKSPWRAKGRISLTGEVTPEGKAGGVAEFNLKYLKSSHAQADDVTGRIPFSFENSVLKVQDARLETKALRVQSVYEQCHPIALLVEPFRANFNVTKPYFLSARASVLVDNLLTVTIDLSGQAGKGVTGTFKMAIPELKSVTSHAAFQEKKDVLKCEGVSLAGRASIAGDFQVGVDQKLPGVVWKADCNMETVRAAFALPAGTIGVTLKDKIEVRGRNAAVELSGNVGFSQLEIQSSQMQVDGGTGRVQFSGDADRIEIKEAQATLQTLRLKEQPAITLKRVKIKGTGIVDVGKQDVRNTTAILSIDGMGPFTAAVTSLSPLDATLEAKSVSLKNVLEKVTPVSGFFKGWNVDGSLDLSLRAKQNLDLSGSVILHLTTLSDPQSRYAAQNLTAKVTLTSSPEALKSTTTLNARAGIEKGEALLGKFYLDFGLTPLKATLNLSSAPDRLWINKGDIDLAQGGSVRFHSRKKELFPLEASIRVNDLNQFFATFIKDSLAPAYPVLNDITVKGKAACDLSLEPNVADGRFLLEEASLKLGSSLEVKDFSLDLPLRYATGQKPPPKAPPRSGKITLGLLETDNFQLRNQEIGLRFEKNAFTFTPLRFPLAGGIVLVSDAVVENPFSSNPGMALTVSLRDIDIGKLQLLPPPYELTGVLGSNGLQISGNKKHLDGVGEVNVDLFEGHAQASDFSLEDPLSPFRRLKCTIKFEQIDLEKFTRAFSFGLITGKLSGVIDNLAISNGQADAFTMKVWSVPVKGVEQTVSFNAVDDIQTISSGSQQRTGLPFGLDRFIGDLSYSQIGIKCVLKNDVFKINGTIQKDHKEYFVSRGGFTGINVVNVNPDNQISFKDMMERVRRVAEKRNVEIK